MAAGRRINEANPMASRWRRRRMCVLVADGPSPVALRDVSGYGAFVETHLSPPLGRTVTLHHPEAGTIAAEIVAREAGGLRLRFSGDEAAVAFALGAIASDMSRPG